MKKNYFLIVASIFSFCFVDAQVTLSQNTDMIITANNSVVCVGGDNQLSRLFDLGSFGVTTDFELTNGEIGVQFCDIGTTLTVNIWDTDGTFPTGFPGTATLLGSQAVIIPVVIPGGEIIVAYNFVPTIVVPASAGHILVEVTQPFNGINFFIGGTVAETANCYLASTRCGALTPLTTDALMFPEAHYYITVTGNVTLSLGDLEISKVTVSPNPTRDILNIKLNPSNSLKNVELRTITGQLVYTDYNNKRLDISNLNSGIYILEMDTEEGKAVKRIVKY